MSYNYYRTADPTWGTSSFRFGPPRAPQFQPQPSWGGLDYYNAHADSPDPSLYHHAWSRLSGQSSIHGVGIQEARHWHRIAYGGLGDIQTLGSYEFGHAAAYEAYRTWLHNSSLYSPISSDRARQREAMIGLAVAEASRLRHSIGRAVKIGRRDSCEAAAVTASVLFNIFLEDNLGDAPYSGQHGLQRSRSFTGSAYPMESYACDDDVFKRHRRRRYGSSSPSVTSQNLSPYQGTSNLGAISIPGAAMSTGHLPYGGSSPYYGGGGSPYNNAYNIPGTIPGTSPYNMGGSSPYGAGGPPYGAGGSPYGAGGSPYGADGSSPYGTGALPYQVQPYGQPTLTPGYVQPTVFGAPQGYPASQPTTYVVQQPSSSSEHKHHHHRHGSGHRHRSRRHRSHSDASYPSAYVVTAGSAYRY